MWSLQVRAQVRWKKCYGAALIYSWGTGLNGSVGLWRCLSALGTWGADLPCRDHPMEKHGKGGLEPTFHPVPCAMGPVGRVLSWHRALSPSQACCSHAQSSLCSSDVSKPSYDTAEHSARWGWRRRSWGQSGAESLPGTKQSKTWATLRKLPWCFVLWETDPK